MTFHLMFVHNTLSSVWVAKWPSQVSGKNYPLGWPCVLIVSCLFFFYQFLVFFSHFGFEGGVWILIGPVPVHCLLVTYIIEFSDISFCK